VAHFGIITRSSELASPDPFSKKGALVLFYLMSTLPEKHGTGTFAVNELARELKLSPGTVHRVVLALEYEGIIRAHGFRTNKRFSLDNPKDLLVQWLKTYRLQKKSRSRQFAIADQARFNSASKTLGAKAALVPALHTAARDVFHAGATNLRTHEFYLPKWDTLMSTGEKLGLIEQDRGYEVLLLQPYYAGVLDRLSAAAGKDPWRSAYAILTFLDLYHFPLRGREQAEVLFRKMPVLSKLCRWSEVEDVS